MTAPIGVTINITAQGNQASAVIAQIRRQLGGIAGAQQRNAAGSNQFADALRGVAAQALILRQALRGVELFGQFISEGLKFNEVIETATIGIASLITAEGRLETASGRILVGAEALGEGMNFATDQVNKLRIAGLRTAATTEQLTDAFQQAVGAGLAAGLQLDEIRGVTVQIVQAAGALGVPLNQLNQEVRSILDATIDRNSRVARVLGITNEQVRLQREQGTLAEFLNQKLLSFTIASEKAADTWKVLKSNMLEAFQVFAGDATRPFFDAVKNAFKGALDQVFDFDQARVSAAFQDLITGSNEVFSRLGDLVSDAIESGISAAQSLAGWFRANRDEVEAFLDEVGETARAIGEVITQAIKVLAGITKWGIETGAFVTALNVVQDILRVVAHLMTVIIPLAITRATALLIAGTVSATARATGLLQVWQQIQAVRAGQQAGGLIGFAAANPGVAAILAAGAAVAGITLLIRAHNEAQKRAIELQRQHVREHANEQVAITNLAAEYAKLTHNIVEADKPKVAVADDILQASTTLQGSGLTTDPKFNEEAARNAETMKRLSVVVRELGKAESDLIQEEIQLRTQLKEGNVTGEQKAAKNKRIGEISRELAKIEGDYKNAIALTTEEIRRSLKVQQELAAQRLITAEITLDSINDRIKETEASLSALKVVGPEAVPVGPGGQAKASAGMFGQANTEKREADKRRLEQQYLDLKSAAEAYTESVLKGREAVNQLNREIAGVDRVTLTGLRGTDTALDKKKAAKLQNDLKQIADAEIGIVRSAFKRLEAEIQQQQALLEISQVEAVVRILAAQREAIEKEIQIRAALIPKLTDLGDRKKQEGEIQELANKRVEAEADAGRKIARIRKDTADQVIDAEIALLEAEGQFGAAARARAEKQFKELLLELQAAGDERAISIVLKLIGIEEIKGQLQEVDEEIRKAQEASDLEIADVEKRRGGGFITDDRAAQELIIIHQKQLEALKRRREEVEQLFRLGGDAAEDAKKKMAELDRQIAELDGTIAAAKEETHEFRNALVDIAVSGLADALSIDSLSLNRLEGAFRDAANSVVSSIQRMIAQIIAFKIVSAGLGLFGIGVSASSAPVGATLNNIPTTAARGGYITGAGTSTSDSIPAWLSHGEYVLRAAVVQKIGVEELDKINFGTSVPRLRRRHMHFAEGGVVEKPAKDAIGQSLNATIGLEEGLVLKHLESNAGQNLLLKIISRNPRAVRAALGVAG